MGVGPPSGGAFGPANRPRERCRGLGRALTNLVAGRYKSGPRVVGRGNWVTPAVNVAKGEGGVGRDAMREALRVGAYGPTFEHSQAAKDFVSDTLVPLALRLPKNRPVRILECGCGAGPWLAFLSATVGATRTVHWYGFDLTPEMLDQAKRRLGSRETGPTLRVGSVLDPLSYRFEDGAESFDLVFAYDVVQQLPRWLQYEACRRMVGALEAGGALAVFDQERFSLQGIGMGLRKFATGWFRVRLVPDYYCAARYPRLRAIAARLRREGRFAEVRTGRGVRKRVLVVR